MRFRHHKHARERRLVEEVLRRDELITLLAVRSDRLLAEGREVLDLAQQCAEFGPSLQQAVDMYREANDVLRQIEARYGVTRSSFQSTPDTTINFEALWCSALADPR